MLMSRSVFEEQRSNNRRTTVFMALTTVWMACLGFWTAFLQAFVLATLAALLGAHPAWASSAENAHYWGQLGAAGALGLWIVVAAVLYARSGKVLPAFVDAHIPTGSDAQRIDRAVARLKYASGNPRANLRVQIWETDTPNAFAAGSSLSRGTIVLTRGLIAGCSDDELAAVIGHEFAHLLNGDALYVVQALSGAGAVVAVAALGALVVTVICAIVAVLISWAVAAAQDEGSWVSWLITIAIGFFLVMKGLSMVLAAVLIFTPLLLVSGLAIKCAVSGLSQSREYLADACAAQWTRHPQGLSAVLRRLEKDTRTLPPRAAFLAPLLLVSWIGHHESASRKASRTGLSSWSTGLDILLRSHPPTASRVKVLEQIEGGVPAAAWNSAQFRRDTVEFAVSVLVPLVLALGSIAAIPLVEQHWAELLR